VQSFVPFVLQKTHPSSPNSAFLPSKTHIRAQKNLQSEHPVPLFHLLKYTIFIFRSLLSDKKFPWRAKAQYSTCFTNSRLKPGVTNRNYLKDFSPNILIRQQCFQIFFLKNYCPSGITILLFLLLSPRQYLTRHQLYKTHSRISFTRSRVYKTHSRVSFSRSRVYKTYSRVSFTHSRIYKTHSRVSFTRSRVYKTYSRISFSRSRGYKILRRE